MAEIKKPAKMTLALAMTREQPLTVEEYLELSQDDRRKLILHREAQASKEFFEHEPKKLQEEQEKPQPEPYFGCHWVTDPEIVEMREADPRIAAKLDPGRCPYYDPTRLRCTSIRHWVECEDVILTQIKIPLEQAKRKTTDVVELPDNKEETPGPGVARDP